MMNAGPNNTPLLFTSLQSETLTFNNSQKEMVHIYFEGKFREGFEKFIEVIDEPHIKTLRAFLMVCALNVATKTFQIVFNFYYPPVEESSPFYNQNVFFRELMFTFNKLCLGEISIDSEIYSQIFDARLSQIPVNTSSPTKKMLISRAFATELRDFVKDFDFINANELNNVKILFANLGVDQAEDLARGFGKSKAKKRLNL